MALSISKLIQFIAKATATLAPYLRIGWFTTMIVGIVLAYFCLKHQAEQRKAVHLLLGSFGLMMAVSSGAQLIYSFI